MSDIAQRLNAIGVAATDLSGGMLALLNYPVHLGRHRGSRIDIAIVSIDLAFTPPAGVHVRAPWGADRPNVTPSLLGNDWRYFSRRLPQWTPPNIVHPLLAYINKVLADA